MKNQERSQKLFEKSSWWVAAGSVAAVVFSASVMLGNPHSTPTASSVAQEKLSARQIKKLPGWKTYNKLCSDCHGKKGDGRGPLGKTMTPEPANYQNCDVLGAVSDEDIKTIILEGSEAIGKSKAMQGFKKKIKSDDEIVQLIEVVRSFGGCAHQ